jgi:hypothetical protein
VRVTIGRRVASPEELEQPGDYSGPLAELDGPDLEPTGRTVVWLLPPDGSGPVRVASPPWEFGEREDGTLGISNVRAIAASGLRNTMCRDG